MLLYLALALIFIAPFLVVGTSAMALTYRWSRYSFTDLLVASIAAPVWLALTTACSGEKSLSNLFSEPAALGAAAGLVPLTAAAAAKLWPRAPRWFIGALLGCLLGLGFHLYFPPLPE